MLLGNLNKTFIRLDLKTTPNYGLIMTALMTTDALAERIGTDGLCLLDGSWYLPSAERDPRAEFAASHIPGAQFFDISAIKDVANPLPHMLPGPAAFENAVRTLGVNTDSQVVIYDGNGIFSAARVWWMFRVMGHDNVFVLDGGLPKWMHEDRPVTVDITKPPRGNFTARFRPHLLADWPYVLDAHAQILDARAPNRFAGAAPEPRKGLRAGHIPGAINIPHGDLKTQNGCLKPASELIEIFAKAGVDVDAPIATSCGSGITACVLALALCEIGRADIRVYDGSWAEWGARSDLPIETN